MGMKETKANLGDAEDDNYDNGKDLNVEDVEDLSSSRSKTTMMDEWMKTMMMLV